jgi:hypothetical protein
MQADYAVELGREDETLEVPWAASDGSSRYHDLKRNPGKIAEIEEAARFPELRNLLTLVNGATSPLETAKCDAWSSEEIHPEEEIFAEPWKFGSYVDLLFSESSARYSFDRYESLLKRLVALLQRAPEIPASAEFLLRRCFYHEGEEVGDGFYVTFYLLGFGSDEAKARQRWASALKIARDAFAQVSFRDRKSCEGR